MTPQPKWKPPTLSADALEPLPEHPKKVQGLLDSLYADKLPVPGPNGWTFKDPDTIVGEFLASNSTCSNVLETENLQKEAHHLKSQLTLDCWDKDVTELMKRKLLEKEAQITKLAKKPVSLPRHHLALENALGEWEVEVTERSEDAKKGADRAAARRTERMQDIQSMISDLQTLGREIEALDKVFVLSHQERSTALKQHEEVVRQRFKTRITEAKTAQDTAEARANVQPAVAPMAVDAGANDVDLTNRLALQAEQIAKQCAMIEQLQNQMSAAAQAHGLGSQTPQQVSPIASSPTPQSNLITGTTTLTVPGTPTPVDPAAAALQLADETLWDSQLQLQQQQQQSLSTMLPLHPDDTIDPGYVTDLAMKGTPTDAQMPACWQLLWLLQQWQSAGSHGITFDDLRSHAVARNETDLIIKMMIGDIVWEEFVEDGRTVDGKDWIPRQMLYLTINQLETLTRQEKLPGGDSAKTDAMRSEATASATAMVKTAKQRRLSQRPY